MKLSTLTIFLSVAVLLTSCTTDKPDKDDKQTTDKTDLPATIDMTGVDLSCLDDLHKRTTFNIFDQTLAEYINSNPNRPDNVRKVIYLLPLGDMSQELVSLIRGEQDYLRIFFQMDVQIMKRVPFDDLKRIDSVKTRRDPNYHSYGKFEGKGNDENIREQIDASSLIKHFINPNMPKDAIVVLGITDHDIYSPKYNWLYGSSNTKGGTGVISTHRLKEHPYYTKLNIRKAISKQVTNAFSIRNVKDFHCLLTFHNNMEELVRGVIYLSPRALEKLKVVIGFDHKKRFEELRDYWEKTEWKEMAGYYDKCLTALNDCQQADNDTTQVIDNKK